MEEARYDTPLMGRFAQLGGHDAMPDGTTRVNFRRVLETHQLAAPLCSRLPPILPARDCACEARRAALRRGLLRQVRRRTAAVSDAQLHQTTTGNQWFVGMKTHRGVEDAAGLVHHVHCTPAHVADDTQVDRLLLGEDDTVCGDSGYTGADTREELEKIAASFFDRGSAISGASDQEQTRSWRSGVVADSDRAAARPRCASVAGDQTAV